MRLFCGIEGSGWLEEDPMLGLEFWDNLGPEELCCDEARSPRPLLHVEDVWLCCSVLEKFLNSSGGSWPSLPDKFSKKLKEQSNSSALLDWELLLVLWLLEVGEFPLVGLRLDIFCNNERLKQKS